MTRTLAIVQARMASTRLPNKVLLDIAGQPMLVRVVERARRAKTVNEVIVATTTDKPDDAIVGLCVERGYPYFRGSPLDVLGRYYQIALHHHAEVIVRLTGDCPLIDPGEIDHTVHLFHEKGVDFAANRLPPPWRRTYPIGLDTEVCTFQALERAWREAEKPEHREHVMPYLYEVEGRFRIYILDNDVDYGHLRWTVDSSEDLELVRHVYEHFNGCDDFTWMEVLDLFVHHPELALINASVRHKTLHEVDERYSAASNANKNPS